jgi:hypothetical protein
MTSSRRLPKLGRFDAFKGLLLVWVLAVIGMSVFTTTKLLPDTEELVIDPPEIMAEIVNDIRDPKLCKELKTWRDIQQCVPSHLVRPLSANCSDSDIDTWDEVQRCLTGRFLPSNNETTNNRPFKVHVVGERHSGTKWITTEMQNCFYFAPESKPFIGRIERDFVRSKHFFQSLRYGRDYSRSIVVVIVRNPVDWVVAMSQVPYHSPNHVANMTSETITPLPWNEFVSKPWTMPRPDGEKGLLKRMETETWLKTKAICQTNFHFEEVIPCRPKTMINDIPLGMRRAMFPVYELKRDGSGNAYGNILELRADKIANHVLQLSLLFRLGGFVLVRYEDLLQKGTQHLMEQVAQIAGLPGRLPRKCKPAKPQPNRLQQRSVPPELKEWVEANVDVRSEQLLGYR